MPRIDIICTELVWPGKYNKDDDLVLPRRVSLTIEGITS